jgi:hypothetical protein
MKNETDHIAKIRAATRRAIARHGAGVLCRRSYAKTDEGLAAMFSAAICAVTQGAGQGDYSFRMRLLKVAGAALLAELKAWPLCQEAAPELQYLENAIALLGLPGDNRLAWLLRHCGNAAVSSDWAESSKSGRTAIEELERAFLPAPPELERLAAAHEAKKKAVNVSKMCKALGIHRDTYYIGFLKYGLNDDDRRVYAIFSYLRQYNLAHQPDTFTNIRY